ncbi:MAG: opacity protein-like surface antigen [Hyphomicrobiaceae bacterium]|jgi:opacity protein-like surface antigen
MMKKQYFVALLAMVAVFGTVSVASAGAYGEPEAPTELPAPPPAPMPAPPVVPVPMPDSGPDYARNGFYLIGAGSYAFEDFDGEFSELADDTGGFNARVGYRFHPNVAAEIEYEWFDDFSKSSDIAEVDEAWALTANAKLYAMTGCIQPYLLLGVGLMSADVDVSGSGSTEEFLGRVGLGTDVYVTENIAVTGDATYLIPTGDLEDLNAIALSLGLMYRF